MARLSIHGNACLCNATVRYQPEEDVVSLVVEGDSSPALEVWILAEDGREHAP